MSDVNFPFEIKDISHVDIEKSHEGFFNYFSGFGDTEFVTVGPKNYFLFANYKEEASTIYNKTMRPTDIVVASLPRSGTTWTQELVWLVVNDLDYETARRISVFHRYTNIGKTVLSEFLEKANTSQIPLGNVANPRFFKTHLPFSLLPFSLIDTNKVVYIARNPKDVAVSTYHVCRLVKFISEDQDFKPFWNYFCQNILPWGPYFENLKEWWQLRHHPNVLFLFYEDLLMDLKNAVQRVSSFFNKEYTDEQLNGLCEHLSFLNIKANKSVNISLSEEFSKFISNTESFIRKGKAGGWRDYFDDEMTEQADRWIADNLQGTDFCFPKTEFE